MKKLILFLAFVSLSFAAVIQSNGTGGGLAGSTSTWTGGAVPGSGDSVIVKTGDTVTDNIGTWTLGGMITLNGQFKTDGAGVRNILFSSTGTVWKTSMFGFDVCYQKSSAYWNLDFSAATTTNYVHVASVNGTSPIAFYADQNFSCGNSTGQNTFPTMNLNNMIVSSPCGSSAASIPCITASPGGGTALGFQLTNSVFSGGGWNAIVNTVQWGTLSATYITSNVWNGFSTDSSCDSGSVLICDKGPYNIQNIYVENNVALNPQSAMTFYSQAVPPSNAFAFTLSGNGWFSSSAYEGPIFSGAGPPNGPILTQYNIVGDIATTYYASSGTPGPIDLVSSNTTNLHTDQYEIYDGTGGAVGNGTAIYQYNIGITPNLRSVSGCQSCGGVLEYNESANTMNMLFAHNVCAVRNVGLVIGSEPENSNICFHSVGAGGTNGTTQSHNTFIASLPDPSGTTVAISPGEAGGTYPDVNSIVKDNLVLGWTYGITPDTSNTNNPTACAWGGAACNNWTYNNTDNYLPTTAEGNHWDNGTTPHPAAIYDDIWQVAPVFPNMPSGSTTGYNGQGPYRGLIEYDTLIGGPGTMSDIANCMALFNSPLAATAGITSIAPPAKCNPQIIYKVISSWYQPLNINQANAASDSTAPGAFPPLVMGSWIN